MYSFIYLFKCKGPATGSREQTKQSIGPGWEPVVNLATNLARLRPPSPRPGPSPARTAPTRPPPPTSSPLQKHRPFALHAWTQSPMATLTT